MAAGGSSKRISKELAELTANPPSGMTVSLLEESDLHNWRVNIEGPKDTPFAGGNFQLAVKLPKEYPFKPPTLSFKTKIYHPNVSNDEQGLMCLGLLRPDEWKPPTKIADVLRFCQQVLREPNNEDAVEQGIAREYREDRAAWRKTAKEWTKKYASG